MRPCRECGRVNPQEAVYCMTCAAPLTEDQSRKESPWSDYRRDEQEYGPQTSRSYSQGDASSRQEDGRFEKVAPIVEDFVFDVMRAGARLYFGVKDPDQPPDPYRRGGRKPSKSDRLERIKDIIAEARVSHRNRWQQSDNDRTRR